MRSCILIRCQFRTQSTKYLMSCLPFHRCNNYFFLLLTFMKEFYIVFLFFFFVVGGGEFLVFIYSLEDTITSSSLIKANLPAAAFIPKTPNNKPSSFKFIQQSIQRSCVRAVTSFAGVTYRKYTTWVPDAVIHRCLGCFGLQ